MPERLEEALRALARDGEVVQITKSAHGEKYVVDGRLSPYTGVRGRLVRSVWIVDAGEGRPRLITAYPVRE